MYRIRCKIPLRYHYKEHTKIDSVVNDTVTMTPR